MSQSHLHERCAQICGALKTMAIGNMANGHNAVCHWYARVANVLLLT
jgi:hypothetical protein